MWPESRRPGLLVSAIMMPATQSQSQCRGRAGQTSRTGRGVRAGPRLGRSGPGGFPSKMGEGSLAKSRCLSGMVLGQLVCSLSPAGGLRSSWERGIWRLRCTQAAPGSLLTLPPLSRSRGSLPPHPTMGWDPTETDCAWPGCCPDFEKQPSRAAGRTRVHRRLPELTPCLGAVGGLTRTSCPDPPAAQPDTSLSKRDSISPRPLTRSSPASPPRLQKAVALRGPRVCWKGLFRVWPSLLLPVTWVPPRPPGTSSSHWWREGCPHGWEVSALPGRRSHWLPCGDKEGDLGPHICQLDRAFPTHMGEACFSARVGPGDSRASLLPRPQGQVPLLGSPGGCPLPWWDM